MALTDTKIKKLVPTQEYITAKKTKKYSDMNGLQLWVRYTGVKSWVVVYYFNGKRDEKTLGQYPYISLAQARELVSEIKSQIAQGIDPKEVAKQAKIKQSDNRFDIFAQRWLIHQQTRIKERTFKRDSSAYHNHIKPIIGECDIYTLKLSDIMAVHDRLAVAGKTCTARKVIGWINAIYDYTIEKGLADGLANPIPRSISNSLVEHKTKHYPRIKITELPKLLADIDSSNSEPLTKYGFYVLCYTFVRTQELRGMTWQEIDFDTCLWHIPAERMKNKLLHVVPLAPQVIDILQRIKAMKLHDEFVFLATEAERRTYCQKMPLPPP